MGKEQEETTVGSKKNPNTIRLRPNNYIKNGIEYRKDKGVLFTVRTADEFIAAMNRDEEEFLDKYLQGSFFQNSSPEAGNESDVIADKSNNGDRSSGRRKPGSKWERLDSRKAYVPPQGTIRSKGRVDAGQSIHRPRGR